MPPSYLTRAGVAPTPPNGPTTYTALVGMLVGVIIACLSLFDVVPTAEDVSAIGTIVGAAIALVAFVVSAISRTKQATNLAKIAQAERVAVRAENPPRMVAGGSPVSLTLGGRSLGVFSEARTPEEDREPSLPSTSEIAAWGEPEPEVLGRPTDPRLEVPNGSVRPPGVDVGGEAPEAEAAYKTDEGLKL